MSLGLNDLKKKSNAQPKTAKSPASETIAAASARPWDASGLAQSSKSKRRQDTNEAVMNNDWANSHTSYVHDFETFAEAKIEQAQELFLKVESKIKRATSGPLKVLGFALGKIRN